MGRGRAEQPRRLAQKLREVRLSLNYSQGQMAEALEKQGAKIHRGYIGLYEIQERTPTLLIILGYAKLAGISCDYLIDDELELPQNNIKKIGL